jgi:hypothetical protein
VETNRILYELSDAYHIIQSLRTKMRWYMGATILHISILILAVYNLLDARSTEEFVLWLGLMIVSKLLVRNNLLSKHEEDLINTSLVRYSELINELKAIESRSKIHELLKKVHAGQYRS